MVPLGGGASTGHCLVSKTSADAMTIWACSYCNNGIGPNDPACRSCGMARPFESRKAGVGGPGATKGVDLFSWSCVACETVNSGVLCSFRGS